MFRELSRHIPAFPGLTCPGRDVSHGNGSAPCCATAREPLQGHGNQQQQTMPVGEQHCGHAWQRSNPACLRRARQTVTATPSVAARLCASTGRWHMTATQSIYNDRYVGDLEKSVTTLQSWGRMLVATCCDRQHDADAANSFWQAGARHKDSGRSCSAAWVGCRRHVIGGGVPAHAMELQHARGWSAKVTSPGSVHTWSE